MVVRQAPKSGRTPDDGLDYLGLSDRHIADRAWAVIDGKKEAR